MQYVEFCSSVGKRRTYADHEVHQEFLIRAKRMNNADVVVGRRYGEFVRLIREVRTTT